MRLAGGCSGRAVRYEISAKPVRAFQCQCRDCQLDSGGGHSSVFVFPRSALDVTSSVGMPSHSHSMVAGGLPEMS